nr:TerB family tellurite resistance protein [uncultured Prevotella sp.]
MVRDLCAKNSIFHDVDSEMYLNSWITEINEQGGMFLQSYLKELNSVDLNETEQLLIVSLAIKAIEADNRIEYAEVKFFKKIRSRLTVSDEKILAEHPDKEDFLLPDINVSEIPQWDDNTYFSKIAIHTQNN